MSVPNVRIGHYGTAMFRGGERFRKSVSSESSIQATTLEPEDWTKHDKHNPWVRSTTPRFGREKSPITVNIEPFNPPGIGDIHGKGTLAFRQSSERFPGQSTPRSRSSEPSVAGSYVPPGIADEVAKSKRGTACFRGSERFAQTAKTPAVGPYDCPTFVDEVLRSKHNPITTAGERFPPQKRHAEPASEGTIVIKGVGDVPKRAGTPATFGGSSARFSQRKAPPAEPTHLDPTFDSLAAHAEKEKGKGTWSRMTSSRIPSTGKPAAANAELFVPKPFGSDAHVPSFGKTSERFRQEKRLSQSVPYYDPPSFVDLILRK